MEGPVKRTKPFIFRRLFFSIFNE